MPATKATLYLTVWLKLLAFSVQLHQHLLSAHTLLHHRMAWDEQDHSDHLVSPPCRGKNCQPLDQAAHGLYTTWDGLDLLLRTTVFMKMNKKKENTIEEAYVKS